MTRRVGSRYRATSKLAREREGWHDQMMASRKRKLPEKSRIDLIRSVAYARKQKAGSGDNVDGDDDAKPPLAARIPKSVILMSPSLVTMTFVGARPRCVSPRPCA